MDVCDKKIFAAIYEENIQKVSDFLYYKYGSDQDTFDVAQEAFVKLWKNCKKVPPEKAKGYLYTVANNTMLNALKHQKVVLKHQQEAVKDYDQEDPQFLLEEQQFLKKYERALAGLSENQRVVFLLNRVEGRSHQEIAELLDLSVRAVRKRLYMAVENLRKHIDGI